VFNPSSETLVEYTVPSRNPNWADCEGIDYCGVAQVFDFAVYGEKIWFTEWVENNIGVVDTSIPLPIEIQLESDSLTLAPGDSQSFDFVVSPTSQNDMFNISLILSSTHEFLDIAIADNTPELFQLDFDAPRPIRVTISASDNAVSGTYKVLLGAQSSDIAISKYVTVTIE